MALNRKTFKKAAAAADTNLPSGYFNTVLYTGNGGTQRIGGYINRGAVFNGSSSYIDAGNINLGTNNVSVSLWVYPNSSQVTYANIIDYNHSSAGGWAIQQDNTSTNSYKVSVYDGSTYYASSAFSLNANQWSNVVFTVTSAGAYNIYVNNGTPTTGTGLTGLSASTNNTLNIGRWIGGTSRYWGGKIDQVRIFNKALSSSEVTTLYGETHTSTTKSTTDIFDDASGVALYQLDGNANDTGGVSGYIGEGAIFNGSSSKVTIPNVIDFSTGEHTISAWVYFTDTTTSRFISNFYSGTIPAGSFDFVWIPSSSSINIDFKVGGSNYTNTITSISTGQWYHIAATFVNNGTCTAYLNGSLVDTVTAPSFTASSYQALNLGYYQRGGDYWEGKIDQVRIYDKALSSSEVSTLYGETASSNITISDLVAYYPMEGTSLDQEGSYHGTDTNVEYNYNGTATNVTYQEATNFSPDLVWIKERNNAVDHLLFDTIRGAGVYQRTNLASNEPLPQLATLSSFDSNGFSVGTDGGVNGNNDTYVAWCFNAGTDAAASNTDGTITSTVKANQDAGFSIVKYTGNGSTGTVGHGLSSTPELIIRKDLDAATDWWVYAPVSPYYGYLNHTDALQGANNSAYSYNQTTPTSTVFSVGNTYSGNVNSNNYIAYNFHSVDGIQKVGSYTGTGASGLAVETGFQLAFLMIKNTDSAHDWVIFDNKRDTANPNSSKLSPNTSGAEYTNSSIDIDFTSNGFVIQGTDDAINDTSDTHIYLAIAADTDTTTPTVEDSFEVVTYTGTGSTQSIDTGFKPDLVWIKDRDAGYAHQLYDTVRGATEKLHSNTTAAESTDSTGLTAFDSNGFTISTNVGINTNNNDYVAWCWKAGDHDDNLPQINTEGTIDSVVSVNDAAGFSVSKFNIPSSGSSVTVGHGLSSAPQLLIVKTTDKAGSWFVYTQTTGASKEAYLELSNAWGTDLNRWANTAPTSSVFTLGSSWLNSIYSGGAIAYSFTSITGYQKIGSYTGTSSTGNAVTTGFEPRFVLIKGAISSNNTNWWIFDNARNPTNPLGKGLIANLSAAEQAQGTYLDFNSNGFTWLSTNGEFNLLNDTYIYLAIK